MALLLVTNTQSSSRKKPSTNTLFTKHPLQWCLCLKECSFSYCWMPRSAYVCSSNLIDYFVHITYIYEYCVCLIFLIIGRDKLKYSFTLWQVTYSERVSGFWCCYKHFPTEPPYLFILPQFKASSISSSPFFVFTFLGDLLV